MQRLAVTATPRSPDSRGARGSCCSSPRRRTQGSARDFDALCRLGAVEPSSDPILLVRRSRADVGLTSRRRVGWHPITPTPRERELHEALLTYARHVWTSSSDAHAPRLAMTLLMKRASSSHEALLRSCVTGSAVSRHATRPIQSRCRPRSRSTATENATAAMTSGRQRSRRGGWPTASGRLPCWLVWSNSRRRVRGTATAN